MNENLKQHDEAQRRWDTEWGPEISPWKRRLAGIAVILAFLGILVGALITAEG